MYKVIDILPLEGNTAVTIEGTGTGLRNGIYIKNEKGVNYYVISIGTVRKSCDTPNNATELLIDGSFSGNEFSLV